MASKKQVPEENQAVGQAVSGAEVWLKQNGKLLGNTALVVLVVIAALFALNKWYLKPAKQEALGQMFAAERYFAQGEFEKALNGDGNALGFAEISAQYGSKAGKIVNFYEGVCQLQLKNYDEAVKCLSKYNGKDAIIAARALCCLGDAYVGAGDSAKGLASYEKAIAKSDNVLAAQYLLKAGLVAEQLGQKEKALGFYQTIADKYPESVEAYDIQKYIYRLK